MVLLHGRGSDMNDLRSLVRVVPRGGVLVTPQAPHPAAPMGYGPGWAWYRYLGEDRVEPQSLEKSLQALEAFLAGLPESLGFRPGSLVLGGFSQGGTTSLAFALGHSEVASALVVLSSFLVSGGSLGEPSPGALGDTPIFWGHGTADPAVPFALAVRGRSRILEAGGRLEARDYPMGHGVIREEVADLADWLERAVPGWIVPKGLSGLPPVQS